MEITKPNDMFVASINNPNATTNDLMSLKLDANNTSLFSKDEYKATKLVQDKFKTPDGKFDDLAFNNAYTQASNHYAQMTNDDYVKSLSQVTYSPFDVTRPKDAKTSSIDVEFSKDFNPFKQLYSRSGINSIDDSQFSLRELAQQEKVFDVKTNTWSKESLNNGNLLDKFFGQTLVYAQWDEDGVNINPETGKPMNHKKGDWKTNSDGNLYLETLGDREIYGKQVLNPMDTLTTDGSIANKFDFMDSDGREKSIAGTAFKLGAEIAPFLIPGFGEIYGGAKAALSLASVLPTFYKSLEGLLIGDNKSSVTDVATAAEGYMAKYTQDSVSDEGSQSMFGVEQISNMVASTFSQIYEQRAMASLSKHFIKADVAMEQAMERLAKPINNELMNSVLAGKISIDDLPKLSQAAMAKIPELESIIKAQSHMSQALSLGYMALTSSGDVYGKALAGGYDRRTAGFATLLTAAGQYGIMMNNEMGKWFLDKTTGYTEGTNRALMQKSITPWLKEIDDVFSSGEKLAVKKGKLADIVSRSKRSFVNLMTSPSVLGENMWKNSLVEGVEEVTEQMVQDATQGMVDVMSYLGLTKKQGSFGTVKHLTSHEGFEEYLANFVGGIIGGSMFEFHRTKIGPMLGEAISPETEKSIYELVADGKKDELIKMINKQKHTFGNSYLSSQKNEDGTYSPATNGQSQSDFIADIAIQRINEIDGIINGHGLATSDEEIVRKAIRDKIIIDDLEKARPKNDDGTYKAVGLEGLILDDYKNNMSKIVKLELQIKGLGESGDNQEQIAKLSEELNIYKRNIEDITSGEIGNEYFDQMMMYLSKKVNAPYLNVDKQSFAKHQYNIDYNSLPEKGFGLTKERITNEWLEYVDSTDLKAKLKVATGTYKEMELTLNKSIAEFVESGYDIVRAQTFKGILDIDETIKAFNTATSDEEKTRLMDKFIAINTQLEELKQNKIGTWDVLNNDMYEQLSNLGLIMKVDYSKDETGVQTESTRNFTKDELNEVLPKSGVTKSESNKHYVQGFFKSFPMNPLNAESIIELFNGKVTQANAKVLKQIDALETKPDQTPEDLETINQLQNSLIDVKIGSFENLPEMSKLKKDMADKILKYKTDNDITDEKLREYALVKANPEMYSKTFANLLSEIQDVNNWSELNKTQTVEFLNKLKDLGILLEIRSSLSGSENAGDVIEETISKLSGGDDYDIDETNAILDTIFDKAESLLDGRFNLNNDDSLKKAVNFIEENANSLKNSIDKIKPDILKLHNYALDLYIEDLKAGNADREVYIEAKKLFDDEVENFKAIAFPGMSNLSNEDLLHILADSDNYAAEVTGMIDIMNMLGDREMTLQEVIDNDFKFEDPNLEKIMLNNFDMNTKAMDLVTMFSDLDETITKYQSNLKRINDFIALESSGLTLKSNTLYDFIRKFELSLNSNPKSNVNKIFDILKREDTAIKAASSITNYTSDNIREQDIKQAMNTLEMIKSVVNAMSTTEVNYGDPYGFITSRQAFVKRNNIESDVSNLFTITSDVATLMEKDIDRLITKLGFVKELAQYNSVKIANEEEAIRFKMTSILLDEWGVALKKLNPAYIPVGQITSILESREPNSKKLLMIEDAVYDHNKDKKGDALGEFLKHLEKVNPSDFSKIDKDVSAESVKSWDLAVYFTSILSVKSSDFNIKYKSSINGVFSKAPFYTQELAARIAQASVVNPELFAKIYTIKKNSSKFNADFITMVLGGAGTGKTTAVFGLILDILRQTNEITNLWVSAPTTKQVDNLNSALMKSIGDEKLNSTGLNKDELWDKLGIKSMMIQIQKEIENPHESASKKNDYVRVVTEGEDKGTLGITLPENWEHIVNFNNLPNLLLIDEVTHYSFAELHILNEISRLSYNKNSTNFMKIIGAGDPTQLGYLADIEGSQYQYNTNVMNAIFTPRLWTSIRSSSNQKRDNNDMYVGLTQRVDNIYNANNGNPEEAAKLSLELLTNVNTITALSYHISDEKITGDIITKDTDKSLFMKLKNIIDVNPEKTIGIMTDNGTLDSKLNDILTEVGLIKSDGSHPNISIFTPKNIQGSEINYFMFDSSYVNKFDKVRDKFKAFYTYMSRSIDASIIFDSDGTLGKLNIVNADKSSHSLPFELLTSDVISKIVEKRNKDLSDLLGPDPKSSGDDDFKWKIGSSNDDEEIIDSVIVDTNHISADLPDSDLSVKKSLTEKLKKLITKDQFKYMLHSFYNNPNAVITESSIKVNPNNSASDLNLNNDINDKKEVKATIDAWTKLKNHLLHNLKMVESGKISSSGFKNYLKNIFTESSEFNNDQSIETELVLTASSFKTEVNTPYAKHGLKISELVEEGQPFINLSVKLKFGDAYHYITLATFGKRSKLEKHINKYITNETDRNELLKNLDVKYNQIEKTLNLNPNQIVEISNLKSDQLSFITNTRLEKILDNSGNKLTHILTDLDKAFPGMNHSEIRMYPGNLEAFTNLINKYTFGEPRSSEQIKELFEKLKNKPYIVVSYSNDLEGSISGEVQSRLIPVGSNHRDFKTVINEVEKLRREVAVDLHEEYALRKADGSITSEVKIKDDFSAKAETLLNRSQILDALIKWGTTPTDEGTMLDLLTKEITFNAVDEIFNKTSSILNVLTNFKDKVSRTTDEFSRILDFVKDSIKSHADLKGEDLSKAVKADVVRLSKGVTGWHWNFYNLFAYKSAINNKQEKDFLNLLSDGVINTDAILSDDGYKEMIGHINNLMNAISTTKFFYSLPIKSGNDGLVVNPYINGSESFSPEFFGDKFFINVTPESERLLVDLNDFFNSKTLDTKIKTKPEETKEEKAAREAREAQEELDKQKAELQVEEERIAAELAKLNNPISSFITDSKVTNASGDVVEPFEKLYDFMNVLQGENGLKLPGVLIGADELISLIKNLQNSPHYSKNKNSTELINMFFGINVAEDGSKFGLAIPKGVGGSIKKLDLVKKIIDISSSSDELITTVSKYCKDILDQIKKCK